MLSLQQKLYQLIINRLDGGMISSSSYAERAVDLVRRGIGGFIVFGGKKDEVSSFIDKLQSLAETPLFIASDIERGVGQQLEGATHFPGQMSVAAATDRHDPDSVRVLEDTIKAVAFEAVDAGINMPLIPVLDVNRNPDNPIICTRAFSDDPEVVTWFGRMYIDTLEKTGLISCAKHFPGHGDTAVDSHISLPVISKSLEELNNADLIPFIEAVKANVSSIMMGHISVPAIDDLPASLSKKAAGLLRNGLGYEGLILTDALNMHALKEVGDIAVKCMNAGVDIILHPESPEAVVEELYQAIEAGRLAKEKIETAVARILKYKARIKNIRKAVVDPDKNEALSRAVSDKSITLVKGTARMIPVRNVRNASLVFSADENKHDLSALKNFIPESIHIREYEGVTLKDVIIVALFTRIAAWEGSSGIRDEEINIIKGLIKSPCASIVISFGNPYVLRHFMEADMLIAAYDTTEHAQSSVIKCLKGEVAFQGHLPVRLRS